MIDAAPTPPSPDAFFDQIVDGGLTPAQLREAFDRLDREPDGWKRCAMAFLEAQCWRESFRAMADASPAASPGILSAARAPLSARIRPASKWPQMAMAAGIAAISFALGWGIHPGRVPLREPGPSLPLATGNSTPAPDVAKVTDSPDSIEGPSGTMPDDSPSSAAAPSIQTVGRVRVSSADGAPAVPIVGGRGVDEQWLNNQPPSITEHQMALLEQQGYQVDRRRRVVTATLRDGRRVAVPVDRFQVRYTGTEPF
jgi:hypothetical protein